jgi:hypothetical protein
MTARQDELDAGLVCLKNVALTHKYADPVAVDITINMGGERVTGMTKVCFAPST